MASADDLFFNEYRNFISTVTEKASRDFRIEYSEAYNECYMIFKEMYNKYYKEDKKFLTYIYNTLYHQMARDLRHQELVRLPDYIFHKKKYKTNIDTITYSHYDTPKAIENVLGKDEYRINVIDLDKMSDDMQVEKIFNYIYPEEKQLLKMKYYDDMTLDEISKRLGITIEGVRVRLNKVLREIKRTEENFRYAQVREEQRTRRRIR